MLEGLMSRSKDQREALCYGNDEAMAGCWQGGGNNVPPRHVSKGHHATDDVAARPVVRGEGDPRNGRTTRGVLASRCPTARREASRGWSRQYSEAMQRLEAEKRLTSMNDSMDIVEICQSFQDGERDVPNDVDIDGTNLLVDVVK